MGGGPPILRASGGSAPADPESPLERDSRRLSAYYVGQVGVKALHLAGIVLATRAVGPPGWGILTALVSAGFILAVGLDLGFNPYVTRELAAGHAPKRPLLAATGRYRAASTVLFALAFPVVISLTVSGVGPFVLSLLLCYLLADSWAKYFFSLLRGLRITRYEVLGGNLEKTVFGAASVLALLDLTTLPALLVVALGFASGAALKLAVALVGARRSLSVPAFPIGHITRTASRARAWLRGLPHLRGSADFLFMAVFSTIYFRIDAYMLAALRGNAEAGFYGAAYRLVEGLLFAPEGVLVVFSPLLVSALQGEAGPKDRHPDAGPGAVRRVAALQAAIGAPLALGFMLEHEWITVTVYGAGFRPAAPVLLWLGPALGFMSLNFLLGGLLTAGYRQRSLLVVSAAAAAVNVALNAVLIPAHGALGATWATVATEGLVSLAMARRVATLLPLSTVLVPMLRIGAYFGGILLLPALAARAFLPVTARIVVEVGAAALFLLILVRRGEIPDILSLARRGGPTRARGAP